VRDKEELVWRGGVRGGVEREDGAAAAEEEEDEEASDCMARRISNIDMSMGSSMGSGYKPEETPFSVFAAEEEKAAAAAEEEVEEDDEEE
jgi:hypothetical protein